MHSSFDNASLLLGYLDPGTGSFMLQMAIAGLLSSLYLVGQSWQWIKATALSVVRHHD